MKVRSDDEQDFRAVYTDVFPLLLRVVCHITGSEDSAEEVCQEAFIRFYDKGMEFPSREDAKFWLIRVAKNLAINQAKRHGREICMVEKLKRQPSTADVPDGAQHLMEQETREEVRDAISRLPEKFRLVIVLKEYSDMDYRQISQVLHISVSNVKVRVFRARKLLEQMLGPKEE